MKSFYKDKIKHLFGLKTLQVLNKYQLNLEH